MTGVAYGKPETTQAEPLCEAPAASTRLAKLSSAQRSGSTKALDGAKLGLETTGNREMDAYQQAGAELPPSQAELVEELAIVRAMRAGGGGKALQGPARFTREKSAGMPRVVLRYKATIPATSLRSSAGW